MHTQVHRPPNSVPTSQITFKLDADIPAHLFRKKDQDPDVEKAGKREKPKGWLGADELKRGQLPKESDAKAMAMLQKLVSPFPVYVFYYEYMYVYVYVYVYVCVCIYGIHTCMYVCIYRPTHIRT
jgi:hypothetical protein